MIAALYIRVSTDDQLEFSPDAQKRALTEYAKRNGYEVNEQYIFIDEGISGTSAKKRPAFMQMIGTAKTKPKPFDAILVHKFDRFARSREDSVVYKSLLRKECGIKVISITEQIEDDKFSVILEAMLEAMAEYYSLNLSDEVMKGMKEKARRGGVQSSPVIGYDIIENKYVLNDEESKIVKMVFDLFLKGESCRSISFYLNNLGLRNKRGNLFSDRVIRYMLQNPVYCGVVRWNYATQKGSGRRINKESEWIIAKGDHTPIITEDEFNKVQNIFRTTKTTTRPISNGYRHWLGGVLRCKYCGGTLTFGTRGSKKNGKSYTSHIFSCNNYRKGKCIHNNSISVANIEKEVLDLLHEVSYLIEQNGNIENLNVNIKDDQNERLIIERQIDKLNKKLLNAKNAYLNDVDTLEEYKENKRIINSDIKRLKSKLTQTTTNTKVAYDLKKQCDSVIELIQNGDKIEIINEHLKDFIECIEFDKYNDTLELKMFYNNVPT